MMFHKKLDAHWFVLLPSFAVLALVASVVGILALFAGRANHGADLIVTTPEAVAVRYAAAIEALKRDISASSDSPEALVSRAEEMLLALRVPQERLDAHLAAVIQLRALGRALPTMDAVSARERLVDILQSL